MKKIRIEIPRLDICFPLGIILVCLFFLGIDTWIVDEKTYSVMEGLPSYYESSDLYVDINHATQEELMKINGIGQKLSAEILKTRETIGGFKTYEDLLQVKGIGEKLLEKISPYIEIK